MKMLRTIPAVLLLTFLLCGCGKEVIVDTGTEDEIPAEKESVVTVCP